MDGHLNFILQGATERRTVRERSGKKVKRRWRTYHRLMYVQSRLMTYANLPPPCVCRRRYGREAADQKSRYGHATRQTCGESGAERFSRRPTGDQDIIYTIAWQAGFLPARAWFLNMSPFFLVSTSIKAGGGLAHLLIWPKTPASCVLCMSLPSSSLQQ